VLVIEDSNGQKNAYVGDLKKANFGNSIIYGNNSVELELVNNNEKEFNYFFENCIIQVPDTFKTSNKDHFVNVWKGDEYDPLFVDPYVDYNYELDTLSPAKDVGKPEIAAQFPLDILNKDRTSDAGPDLGAFERIEKKDEE